MNSAALIAPDFAIILLGLLLRVKLGFEKSFWEKAEKLVFYVLFPPLLFTSIAGSNLSLGASAGFLAVGVGTMVLGVAASRCVRFFVKGDAVTQASLFQCGFRFNTYIGFALVVKLFGDEGFALLALLIAFWVPISNTIAVAALAAAVARRDAEAGAAVAKRAASSHHREGGREEPRSSSRPCSGSSSASAGSSSRIPCSTFSRVSAARRSRWGSSASGRACALRACAKRARSGPKTCPEVRLRYYPEGAI